MLSLTEAKNVTKSKSASFCQEPHRKVPGKVCGDPVLSKGMCRYHYDKLRAHKLMNRTLEPKNRQGVIPLPVGSVDLYPEEVRVFQGKVASGNYRSMYHLVCEVLGKWAREQPEFTDPEKVRQLAPEMIDLATLAKDIKPGCKCGECLGCKARSLMARAR